MDSVFLFHGLVSTAYGQIYVGSGEYPEPPMPDDAFRGQANGLCGAAVPGALFLITGTHTGQIPVDVIWEESEPALQDWAEEIVEASFDPRPGGIRLDGWGGEFLSVLALPSQPYRVRWSGAGMDAARGQTAVPPEQPAEDRYLLEFWPAPAAPDRIVRVTSDQARYWHEQGFTRRR